MGLWPKQLNFRIRIPSAPAKTTSHNVCTSCTAQPCEDLTDCLSGKPDDRCCCCCCWQTPPQWCPEEPPASHHRQKTAPSTPLKPSQTASFNDCTIALSDPTETAEWWLLSPDALTALSDPTETAEWWLLSPDALTALSDPTETAEWWLLSPDPLTALLNPAKTTQ